MAGEEPITLNRGEVQELWRFMEEVRGVMETTKLALADHEVRLRQAENSITTQRSENAFTRWVAPQVLALGALAVSFWMLVKRTNGG